MSWVRSPSDKVLIVRIKGDGDHGGEHIGVARRFAQRVSEAYGTTQSENAGRTGLEGFRELPGEGPADRPR